MGAIRLYLALAVVACHVTDEPPLVMVPAEFAVIMFYMISGFYISMVINAKYTKLPLLNFYRARALRLLPIYYVVLLISASLIWFFGTPNFVRPWHAPTQFFDWARLIFSNLTFFNLDNVEPGQRLVSVAWTLGIEVQFYLVAPFLVTRRLAICVTVLAAALAWRMWLVHTGYSSYTYAPAQWCFFAMGWVSHRIFEHVDQPKLQRAGWLALAAIVALAYMCNLHGLDPSYPGFDRPKYWLFYTAFALSLPALFALTKSSAVDRYIGEVSYPVYISHLLAIGIASKLLPLPIAPTACLILIALAVAIALHQAVQVPLEKLLRREWSSEGLLSRAPRPQTASAQRRSG